MAGESQGNVWPLPKFYFSVDIGSQTNLPFQEVSGLDTETQVIEYRAGNNKVFSTIKMPGIAKFGNVTMKVDRFKELWKNGIAFVVHPPNELMIGDKKPLIAARISPDETIITRGIGVAIPANPLY